jgi:hypothetical protein
MVGTRSRQSRTLPEILRQRPKAARPASWTGPVGEPMRGVASRHADRLRECVGRWRGNLSERPLVIFKTAAVQRQCNGADRNGQNWLGPARNRVSGNPYNIGRFSSGQVRPGPPYDISNPAGAKILLILQGFSRCFKAPCNKCATAESFSLPDEPAEGVRRDGVSIRLHMQITLGRDSDRGIAQALTHDFERGACLSAETAVRVAQPVQ